jgi:ElaB/YqjD/DUF883 family membrane-anchored ribosome-binding protein
MAKETIEKKQEGAERAQDGDARAALTAAGGEALEQAKEASQALRAAIDQASHTLRALRRASEGWARHAEGRTGEIGKGSRGPGERAVGGVARQVEQNPLTSVAIAFAVGFLCAAAARR